MISHLPRSARVDALVPRVHVPCGPQGKKDTVLATKVVETQGKGTVLATKAVEHTRPLFFAPGWSIVALPPWITAARQPTRAVYSEKVQ